MNGVKKLPGKGDWRKIRGLELKYMVLQTRRFQNDRLSDQYCTWKKYYPGYRRFIQRVYAFPDVVNLIGQNSENTRYPLRNHQHTIL